MRYDLKHLSTFIAVAEELNFHRAAERLAMAQPAVSRIVLELEDRLGVKLLERTTRKVRLTESGRYLLEEAQEILGRIEVAENTTRLLASGTKAVLRVGYTTITGHSVMPDITREFRQANPDVRVELSYMTSPAQRDKILQDEIDLGLIEGPFQSSEIESRLVARHKLWALLPPRHPLAAKQRLTIEDLATEEMVIGTNAEWPTFRRIVVDAFQSAGLVMKVAQEAQSLTGLLGLVTAGVGITVFTAMPRFCGENAIVPRPVVTNPPVLIETRLVWRRTSINMAKRRFIEASQKVAASYMAP
ncbi:LysR family transcriptional regulator [Mesorhizobium marinum]|uniref:LysR family transcriptional regulator n=1 Tax=Mesorhizobium marinum TaxID=3228790 RepID=A0ABV3QTF0_9HYPH